MAARSPIPHVSTARARRRIAEPALAAYALYRYRAQHELPQYQARTLTQYRALRRGCVGT
eukprot:191448-Rhodomonas_salina.1